MVSKLQYPDRPTKVIRDGKKVCRGPKHPIGGEWVPLTNYLFHKDGRRAGKPYYQCRDCMYHYKLIEYIGQHGYVPTDKIRPYVEQMYKRLGIAETCRRIGTSPSLTRRIRTRKYLQKRTAQRILLAFKEMNENQEHRHHRSIKRGHAMRGEKELTPRTTYAP